MGNSTFRASQMRFAAKRGIRMSRAFGVRFAFTRMIASTRISQRKSPGTRLITLYKKFQL